MATIEAEIDRLFPKCRVRSPKPETGILIDLGDENQNPMDTVQSQPCHRESDSDDLQAPLHSVPSYPFAQRVLPAKMRGCDSTEQRRKLPRPRTLDLYESQGAGYEPSPDSEDNDSDFAYKVSSKKLGFRTSASESHISNKWRKQEVKPKRSSKEIYDVNPSRHDGCSTGESRMEIAGGREVLSRSRARTQRKRQSLHVSNSSANTKVRTVNRYSGEVYYEESVGRYGFHVDGSTLWGSQGLEPSFSIPSSLSEKATPSHSVKRPLSWSGDGVSPTGQSGDSKTGLSEMPQILDYLPGEHAEESRSTNVLQGYLTDFYPELLNNEVNGTDGRSGSTLNLDNYSLEQLNQFAQSRKELGGGHEDNCASLATVIGGLTIAQYEGSPRRYGPRSAVYDSEDGKVTNSKADITASTGPPRPGFPRRVTTFDPTDSKSEPTFSPSVTRQALVHMSQGLPDTPSTQMSLSIKDLSPLCVRNDLNAYKAEDSRLFLGPVKDEGDRDTTSTNAETDLGETEVGQVVGQSRNFTLSPETTDCDSDLEEPGEKAPLILPESPTSSQSSKLRTTCVSYKFNSMPVLEDGLSSGRNSDDETELIDPLQSAAHSNRPMKTMLGLPLHNETTKIKNMNNGMGPMPSVRNAVQLKPRHVSNAAQSQQHGSMIKTPNSGLETEALDPSRTAGETPPPPAPLVHRPGHFANSARDLTGFIAPETSPQSCHFNSNQKASEKRNSDIATTAPKERGYTSRSRKTISLPLSNAMQRGSSPVWVPRQNCESWSHITSIRSRPKSQSNREEGDDEDKKETDQLLDDTSREDHGFYDEKTATVQSTQSQQPPVSYSLTLSSSLPRSSTSPTASSFHSISTASSSHSSPHQSTNSNPNSRHSEPKDMKYTEVDTPPAPNKDENQTQTKKKGRGKEVIVHEPAVLIEGVLFRASYLGSTQIVCEGKPTKVTRMMQAEEAVSRIKSPNRNLEILTTANEEPATGTAENAEERKISRAAMKLRRQKTRRDAGEPEEEAQPLLSSQVSDYAVPELSNNNTNIVVNPHEEDTSATCDINANMAPASLEVVSPVLDSATPPPDFESDAPNVVEGCSFRLRYFGSLDIAEVIIDSDGNGGWKFRSKKNMVEEAVLKLKAPDGETQPTTEVDLFISTEKIMVLNTELKEIMMDHSLRTISYIADIGDLVVIMARRRLVTQDGEDSAPGIAKIPKMICHVFESEEAQFIAQSIGQAFQVAYMEFLKANGIEDQSFVREMDYQEVLNSQEIFSDEIQMFAKKELQKEVIVPKARNEILGVVIVESGWGSMLPTVVIANLAPAGAAARCGQLNIGDQIIAINGVSLVGLPLSTCQTYIKNAKSATVVKLTVVPCPPVVEVKIKRPDTKYQLGFSVQNGVICSLLRGGIAERGGVRVGHRIIEINGQSVVAVPHERIVGLLATSVGEIHMKTMPTSMFRLLTGQETPLYI